MPDIFVENGALLSCSSMHTGYSDISALLWSEIVRIYAVPHAIDLFVTASDRRVLLHSHAGAPEGTQEIEREIREFAIRNADPPQTDSEAPTRFIFFCGSPRKKFRSAAWRPAAAHNFFVGINSDLMEDEQCNLLIDAVAKLWQVAMLAESSNEKQTALIREQLAIVEHITDGLLVIDQNMQVRQMNETAGRILKLDPKKSIGRRFSELLDFEPIIQPIFDTGEGYIDRELLIDSPKRHLHLIDTAIPIKDKSGHVISIVNTFREVDRIRKLAQKVSGNHARYTFENIVGSSKPLGDAIEAAKKASRGFANVLLYGPSGVGKELFAQSIHNASHRSDGPFIAVNCAALPRDLIESELFGYVPGSFTGSAKEGRAGKFESASGGTIFLDEISELPLDVQAKLLRVLQEREVVRVGDTRAIPINVRIISASNRNLTEMAHRNEFRLDLYYRCHVIGIAIPPLKDRASDIPELASFFLKKYANLLNRDVPAISDNAMQILMAYPWPGNIRELENQIERLINLHDGHTIHGSELSILQLASTPSPALAKQGPPTSARVCSLQEMEKSTIQTALLHCDFNVTHAAKVLGISKPSLYSKIKTYEIQLLRTSRS